MNGKSISPKEIKLKQLKEVFPEVFTEEKVDWEKLKITLGENINFTNERYVLNWAGKSDAFKILQKPTTKTLIPDRNESVNFDESKHIFIKGENLEVLKILQKSYFGKIKMIYIDPPYNTGNDFIYNDKFSETRIEYEKRIGDKNEKDYLTKDSMLRKNTKENGHYHSNWLNMMYPRLFLAKNLLRQDGVIFISIDDNEVAQLRILMDEVFGEENFVGNIIWHKKTQPSFLSKEISNIKEYILFYKKTSEAIHTFGGETNPDKNIELLNISNNICTRYFKKENVLIENGNYTGILKKGIYGNAPLQVEILEDLIVKDGKAEKDFYLKGKFKWSQEKINDSFSEGDTFHIKSTKSLRPTIEKKNKSINIKPIVDILSKKFDVEIATNTDASREIEILFNKKEIFSNPKPSKLIKFLIKSITYFDKNSIILDFFAGSGTTGDAVMQLNADDGGNRKYILVQLPEPINEKKNKTAYDFVMDELGVENPTIFEITKERLIRAIRKIKEEIINKKIKEKEKELKGLENKLDLESKEEKIKQISQEINTLKNQDLGFKVLKLSDSNFKQWKQIEDKDVDGLKKQMELFVDPVSKNATIENMVYELLLKSGKDINSKIEHKNNYYCINDNELVLMFEKADEEIINKVIAEKPQKVIILDRLFKDNDKLKTNTSLQMKDAGIEFKTI